MALYKFNTPENKTIKRELLIAYLNIGTSDAPNWAPLGKRTEDSSTEYDWGEETTRDILGGVYSQLKTPVITQSFEPLLLDSGDKAITYIHKLAIVEQDAPALANQEMLIAHWYLDNVNGEETVTGQFAERYTNCMIKATGFGGEGGGNINMPIEITYGGTRILGTVGRQDNAITFTPLAE